MGKKPLNVVDQSETAEEHLQVRVRVLKRPSLWNIYTYIYIYILFFFFFEEMMQKVKSDQKEKPNKYGHRELYTVYSALQANMTLFSRELIGQQVDVPVDLFS